MRGGAARVRSLAPHHGPEAPQRKDQSVDEDRERVVVVEFQPLGGRRLDAGQDDDADDVGEVQQADAESG